jgi:uncharacterized membrane protein required for colicin V production
MAPLFPWEASANRVITRYVGSRRYVDGPMLDVFLGAGLAWLAVRGWVRGLVREALSLVGLFLGTLLSFRLGGLVGDFLNRAFSWPHEAARVAGGVVLFVLLGVVLGVGARLLTGLMRLPGLNLANRIGGAVLAVTWALAVVLVAVNVSRVLPLPWNDQLDRSTVVQGIAGPDAWPQRMFHRLAGDTVLGALHSLQQVFGSERVVASAGEEVSFPAARSDEVRQVRKEAEMVLEELNRTRTGESVQLLAPSEVLFRMAEARAHQAYLQGSLTRDADCAPEAQEQEGVLLFRCTEVAAIASTSLLAGGESAPVALGQEFNRAGVAVVDGPMGRIVVVVLAG